MTPSTTSPRRRRPTFDASSRSSFISEWSPAERSDGDDSREEDSDSSISTPTRDRGGKFGVQYTAALYRPPVREGLRERHLVGVFQVAADGQPACDATHTDAHRPQQLQQVLRGRVALDFWIRRQNDLPNGTIPDPCYQGRDLQIIGADALDRGQRAVEHVVEATVSACPLERKHVKRLLHDADQPAIAPRILANAAGVRGRDVEARGAEDHAPLHLGESFRQFLGNLRWGAEQEECKPLRRLRSDAGQSREGFNEPGDRLDSSLHESPGFDQNRPGIFMLT